MKRSVASLDYRAVEKISRKYLFIIFIVFSLCLLAAGYYVYSVYYEEIRHKVKNELISVSKMKTEEIVHWRSERIRNLSILQNRAFSDRIKRTIENPGNAGIQDEMLEWLVKFGENYSYDRVCIHDMKGIEILYTSKSDIEMPHPIETYYKTIFEENEIVFDDFYWDSRQNKVYLPLLVGIRDLGGDNRPLGTLICRIDPSDYLYPLLSKWPVPRNTAMFHLLKKSGDDVVFLNQITNDHRFKTGFSLKDPGTRDIPAAKAAEGYTGFYEGRDFKNDPVLTYIQAVPGTDWKLVSKIDEKEAFIQEKLLVTVVSASVVLLIGLLGTGVLLIIRYQRESLYKEIMEKALLLQESEENLRITLESIGDGVISTDNEGRIRTMNSVAEKLTGWNLTEAAGIHLKNVFNIINAYTKVKIVSPAEIVLSKKKAVGLSNHTLLLSKDGKEYHISDSAAPIVDSSGSVHGVILVFSDVTDKYLEQRKIAENERFLNSLISSLNGMVYRCINDSKWSLVYSTSGSIDITGYTPDELTGGKIRFSELVFPEDTDILRNAIENAISGRRHFSVEYRLTDRTGNVKWVLEKGRPVYDEDGELKFIEGFVTDITVSKTAEMEIREKSEELERSNRLMVDRELKMIELKKEVNTLLKKAGKEDKYKMDPE